MENEQVYLTLEQLPEDEQTAVRKAIASEIAASNRWLNLEPVMSQRFGAYFEDGQVSEWGCWAQGSEAEKALKAILTEAHPKLARVLVLREQAKTLKKNPATKDDGDDKAKLATALAQEINATVQNGYRAMRKYFLQQKEGEKASNTRSAPSPLSLAQDLMVKLNKINQKQDIPQAELDFALRLSKVLEYVCKSDANMKRVYLTLPVELPTTIAEPANKSFTQSSAVVDITAQYKAEHEVLV